MQEKHKKIIAGSGVVLFILLSGLVFWFAGKPLLQFVSEPDRFRAWVDTHGLWGRLAFLGMVVLQVIVAVIPGEPLEIAAGYAFGFVEGTLLCMLGMTIGGVLVFAFVRRFGIRAVEVFIPREKIESLKFLQNTKRVCIILVAAFLLPGTPKDVLSYCAGLTKIDQPLGHGDVALAELVGKDVEIAGVFQHQIRRLAPGGYVHDVLLFDQLPVDFTCVALIGCCHGKSLLL